MDRILLARLLYDPRYLAAAVYLSILAVGTALIMITRSMDSLLVASGHVRATLELNVVRVIWLRAVVGSRSREPTPCCSC